jgi:hypothetical protein
MARTFHEDSRVWSLFQPAELVKLCGVAQGRWPVYVLKELLDNALAALEEQGTKNPMVWVTIGRDHLEIGENGSGMPDSVLNKVLDFERFGGSSRHAKLPTRGAQGNALGTVFGIVSAWAPGRPVEVSRPCGPRVSATIELDQVRQEVSAQIAEIGPAGRSAIRVPMPELPWKPRGSDRDELFTVAQTMARLNPHVTFIVHSAEGSSTTFPSLPGAKPVLPDNPACGAASWFTRDDFHARLAADVRARPQTSVVEWLSEFHCASRKLLQSASRSSIGEDTDGADEDEFAKYADSLRRIALASTDRKQADDPKRLQPVGEEALGAYLIEELGADEEATLEYRIERGTFGQGDTTVPFIVEVALVQMPEGEYDAPEPMFAVNRTVLYGSPQFKTLLVREKVRGEWRTTSGDIGALVQGYGVGSGKYACALAVHVTCPSPGYTSYGKSSFDTTWLFKPLSDAMERVTLQVRKQRYGEARRSKVGREADSTIRDTLFGLIPQVWEADTEGGTLPVMLRQLYYGVRKVWHLHHHKDLQYQTYCVYLDEYEQRIAGRVLCWRDPRGTLVEPHSARTLRLGTEELEKYEPKKWEGHTIIFVEKEQFAFLFKKLGLTKRYDAIVIGSKGFAVEACREVLQKYKKLLGGMVKIVAVHDSDPAGYQIGRDLATNLPRFGENVDIQVYDIGLRMNEALSMGLQDEPFDLSRPVWSMINNMRRMTMRDPDGAIRPLLDDAAHDMFLPKAYRGAEYPTWAGKPKGRRVEINAMSPRELAGWLEGHLDRIGAKKVRPPDEVVDAELKKHRENFVRNQVGGALMEMLGEDLVFDILAEIGVPAHDLDAALVMKPEQHWSYLVERAAQRDLDLTSLIKRKLSERMTGGGK